MSFRSDTSAGLILLDNLRLVDGRRVKMIDDDVDDFDGHVVQVRGRLGVESGFRLTRLASRGDGHGGKTGCVGNCRRIGELRDSSASWRSMDTRCEDGGERWRIPTSSGRCLAKILLEGDGRRGAFIFEPSATF